MWFYFYLICQKKMGDFFKIIDNLEKKAYDIEGYIKEFDVSQPW